MSARSKLTSAVALLVLLWAGRLVWDYFDNGSVAHQAMQVQLKLFGAAIYEYHFSTGRWPTSVADLAQTSLPQRSHVWRETARSFTFLWPTDLNPDPKQNANILLVYDHGGLFNKLGRVWVCWGDLRTEHMRGQELRTLLAAAKSRAMAHDSGRPD